MAYGNDVRAKLDARTAKQLAGLMASMSGTQQENSPPPEEQSTGLRTGDIFLKDTDENGKVLAVQYYMYLGTLKTHGGSHMFMNLDKYMLGANTQPEKIDPSKLINVPNPIESTQISSTPPAPPFLITRIGVEEWDYETDVKMFQILSNSIYMILNKYILLTTSKIIATQHRAPYLCNILKDVASTQEFAGEQCLTQGGSKTRRNSRSSRNFRSRSSRRSSRRRQRK